MSEIKPTMASYLTMNLGSAKVAEIKGLLLITLKSSVNNQTYDLQLPLSLGLVYRICLLNRFFFKRLRKTFYRLIIRHEIARVEVLRDPRGYTLWFPQIPFRKFNSTQVPDDHEMCINYFESKSLQLIHLQGNHRCVEFDFPPPWIVNNSRTAIRWKYPQDNLVEQYVSNGMEAWEVASLNRRPITPPGLEQKLFDLHNELEPFEVPPRLQQTAFMDSLDNEVFWTTLPHVDVVVFNVDHRIMLKVLNRLLSSKRQYIRATIVVPRYQHLELSQIHKLTKIFPRLTCVRLHDDNCPPSDTIPYKKVDPLGEKIFGRLWHSRRRIPM